MSGSKHFASLRQADWSLLLAIVTMGGVKNSVKLAGLLAYAVLVWWRYRPGRKDLVRPVVFYLVMPALGALAALVGGAFSGQHYWFTFLNGAAGWWMAGAALLLLRAHLGKLDAPHRAASLQMFFLLNLLVSAASLAWSMWQSGSLMPYWLDSTVYGVSTGDHIYGLLMGSSLVNAAVCAVGLLHFINDRQWRMAACCMLVILLCNSNTVLALLLFCLLLNAVLRWQNRPLAGRILLLTAASLAVYAVLSTSNLRYAGRMVGAMVNTAPPAERTRRTGAQQDLDSLKRLSQRLGYTRFASCRFALSRADMPPRVHALDSIAIALYSGYRDAAGNTPRAQAAIDTYITRCYGIAPAYSLFERSGTPGKLFAAKQTLSWMGSRPDRLLLGAGPGNFSSKLAIKAMGLGWQGQYPAQYRRLSPDFFLYHGHTLLTVYSRDVSQHSVVQFPNTVYNQLGGEYGLLGGLLFLFLYAAYFLRRGRKDQRTVNGLLLFLLLLLFALDYWFEMMSLTLVFEWCWLSRNLPLPSQKPPHA